VIARVLVGRVHRDGRQVLVDGSPLGTR
jgi:hypothetical protein